MNKFFSNSITIFLTLFSFLYQLPLYVSSALSIQYMRCGLYLQISPTYFFARTVIFTVKFFRTHR